MIGHAGEVWLALFAAFAVGSLLGWLLYRAIDRSDYAFDQRELTDALGRRFQKGPPAALEASSTAGGSSPAAGKSTASQTSHSDAAETLRKRVRSSSLAAAWRASRNQRLATPAPESIDRNAPASAEPGKAGERPPIKDEPTAAPAAPAAEVPGAAADKDLPPRTISKPVRSSAGRTDGTDAPTNEEPWVRAPGAWPPLGGSQRSEGIDSEPGPTEPSTSETSGDFPPHFFTARSGHDDIWSEGEPAPIESGPADEAKPSPLRSAADPDIEAAASILVEPRPALGLDGRDRPPGLSEAPSNHDDLKKIKGVGPAFEKKLNQLGIYRYDQIAAWTPAQQNWVGETVGYVGRIERSEWINRAASLAATASGDVAAKDRDPLQD